MSDILLPRKKPAQFPLMVVAAPAAVVAVGFGLWLSSMPPHMRSRLIAVESQAAGVKEATEGLSGMKTFPADSVCTGDFDDAAKQKLNAVLADSGLKIAGFDVTDIGTTGRTGLEAYRFTFKGSGAYGQAMTALANLDAARPRLFVDALALRNHVDSVELEIEGRLFCR